MRNMRPTPTKLYSVGLFASHASFTPAWVPSHGGEIPTINYNNYERFGHRINYVIVAETECGLLIQ